MDILTAKKILRPIYYWDMPILDVQSKYFLDEIYIYVEIDEQTCWKVTFQSCFRVNYETDASWRNISLVRDMRGMQLGYFGQDSFVKVYPENNEFLEFTIDLTIMTMTIICKDINVDKINRADISFF